jgi:hypothetical protein
VSNGQIRIWPAPIALGIVSVVGLVAALLSDDVGDVVAWLALALPVAVVLWYVPPRRKTE